MVRRSGAVLREAVAFDHPTTVIGPGGTTGPGWNQQYRCRAEFIYARGGEAVEAARLTGTAIFKVRILSSIRARQITTGWRMRDVRRKVTYEVTEMDAITDPRWIYAVVKNARAG